MGSDRSDVLAAAQRLLNRDPGASMSAIAEVAGVSRATLHRHFDSRDALLVELGTRSLDQWERRLDDAAVEEVAATGDRATLRAVLEALVLGYVDDSEDHAFALTDPVILANADIIERTRRLDEREGVLLAAAQKAGVLRADLPLRWFGHTIYGLLVAGRQAVRLGDVARRDVPHLVLSTLLAGVTAP